MFCPNCGSQIEENKRFCSGCGTPITAQSNPSDTTPPPTPVQPTPTPLEGGQPIAATPLSTPATPKSEQSAAATPAPIPTYKIVTLPSGKKIKVKNDKAQPATPPKERAPLTDLWAWLLAVLPNTTATIVFYFSDSPVLAWICVVILTIIFAIRDETAITKAGFGKEAPNIGCVIGGLLAFGFPPIFYLFSRAKRINKNYGPAILSGTLFLLPVIISFSLAANNETRSADSYSGDKATEKTGQEQIENRSNIVSKHFNFFKLCANLKFIEAKVMSKEEFEAKWGFKLSEAITLVRDFDRDCEFTDEGTMTEAEFKAKWGFAASAVDTLVEDFSRDFNRDVKRVKAGLMSTNEIKAKWEVNK